jgi:hypothetical protein
MFSGKPRHLTDRPARTTLILVSMLITVQRRNGWTHSTWTKRSCYHRWGGAGSSFRTRALLLRSSLSNRCSRQDCWCFFRQPTAWERIVETRPSKPIGRRDRRSKGQRNLWWTFEECGFSLRLSLSMAVFGFRFVQRRIAACGFSTTGR